MYAGTHIAVGAAIGAAVYQTFELLPSKFRPDDAVVLGISSVAGLVSHFVLDAIPHSEYGGLDIFHIPLYFVLIPEVILISLIVTFLGAVPIQSSRNIMIAAGGFAGAFPDVAWITCSWFDRLLGQSHAFSRFVFSTHGYWHATESMQMLDSMIIQFILIFNALTILNYTRRIYILKHPAEGF